MTPPATHASNSRDSDGSVAAIVPGVRKIADPITLVITSSVALRTPMARISRASVAVVGASSIVNHGPDGVRILSLVTMNPKIAGPIATLALCLACHRASPPLAAIVDEYLDQFARRHPSIAAGNGIHTHDATLEDFSAGSIAAEVEWLRSFRHRLDAVDLGPLTPDERVDHRILQGIVDGWLLDLDTVRTWTRNPMIYASAISDGVHNLMTMESSPVASRMMQASAKLTAVPTLLASARENLHTPPRVFVERAIVMFRGASDLVAHDLPLAFASVADPGQQESLKSAADAARRAIDDYVAELESKVLPQ